MAEYVVKGNVDVLLVRHVRANRSGRYDIDRDFHRHATRGGITTVAGDVVIEDRNASDEGAVEFIIHASGIAVCSPIDTFSREEGFKRAFERAAAWAVENYTRKRSTKVEWVDSDTEDSIVVVTVKA